jgi:hypothetical protein
VTSSPPVTPARGAENAFTRQARRDRRGAFAFTERWLS